MLTQGQRREQAEQRANERAAKFIERVDKCDKCGRRDRLETHEIARGTGDRLKCRGCPWCCLRLCGSFSRNQCHASMGGRPRAEQLALIYLSRPSDFRLSRYNRNFRPMVDAADVLRWVKKIIEERT